jgi:superfamily II DNA or RNA helicase
MAPATTATMVMLTGTGKTDTMLGMLIAGRLTRALVLVPSDSLRSRLVEKCIGMKKLREIGDVSPAALNPMVQVIGSGLSADEVRQLAEANMIVAMQQALQHFDQPTLEALAALCSHLFIDEAHHVAVPTWDRVKTAFKEKPCLQSTATPFREDNQPLDGKIIYNYPLKDAQNDGCFKAIEFHPVREYNLELADQVVAGKAVALLRNDRAQGFNHLLMVRACSQRVRQNPQRRTYGFETAAQRVPRPRDDFPFCDCSARHLGSQGLRGSACRARHQLLVHQECVWLRC